MCMESGHARIVITIAKTLDNAFGGWRDENESVDSSESANRGGLRRDGAQLSPPINNDWSKLSVGTLPNPSVFVFKPDRFVAALVALATTRADID